MIAYRAQNKAAVTAKSRAKACGGKGCVHGFRRRRDAHSNDAGHVPSAFGNVVQDAVQPVAYRADADIVSIAARIVPVDRITIRDAKSYCAVLMDDNNRKPICRLYFNSPTTKNLGLFDSAKNETKFRIEQPSDLYRHSDAIEAVVKAYGA